MKKAWWIALLFAPLAVAAADKHDAQDIKKDIERHKAMAAAHAQAAKCLESGQSPEMCQRQLQGACKGLGIGKYCGMKHEH
jgi:predicted secreted Zn-dependent protease